jgi:hypothetical protein
MKNHPTKMAGYIQISAELLRDRQPWRFPDVNPMPIFEPFRWLAWLRLRVRLWG